MDRKRFFIYIFLLGCFIFICNPLLAEDEVAGKDNKISLDEWIEKAEKHMLNGEDEKALFCFQQVLLLDSKNLSANIFMGNYYYVEVERARKGIEVERAKGKTASEKYKKYQEALTDLWPAYVKAKAYLEVVLHQFPSSEVIKTLNHIEEIYQVIQ
ncbi:MAG: hypothetical protein GX905_06115 [Bacteroidales bacterium]|nr:hypothetical protein [Bacteroidales bacterium]